MIKADATEISRLLMAATPQTAEREAGVLKCLVGDANRVLWAEMRLDPAIFKNDEKRRLLKEQIEALIVAAVRE